MIRAKDAKSPQPFLTAGPRFFSVFPYSNYSQKRHLIRSVENGRHRILIAFAHPHPFRIGIEHNVDRRDRLARSLRLKRGCLVKEIGHPLIFIRPHRKSTGGYSGHQSRPDQRRP